MVYYLIVGMLVVLRIFDTPRFSVAIDSTRFGLMRDSYLFRTDRRALSVGTYIVFVIVTIFLVALWPWILISAIFGSYE